MPYDTISGGFERASRTGHINAIIKALADKKNFFVPAEEIGDLGWLIPKLRSRFFDFPLSVPDRLSSVIGIDGSLMVVPVREGLPSVQYGYAQASAIWLDLEAMANQAKERFIDPVALSRSVNSALISYDLPVAGAYLREGLSIQDSWRESIYGVFRQKKIEVNRLNQSLLQLLFLLHGRPGSPADRLLVACSSHGCKERDIVVGNDPEKCPACSRDVFPTDVLRIHEEVLEEGSNESPLSRLMQVVELLVFVGLTTLLWEQSRDVLLRQTLFIMDGPMAVYGPPAKLRSKALEYFQAMTQATSGDGPFVCGIEKTGVVLDYARCLVRHDAMGPGDLLVVDSDLISKITNTKNPLAYGSETYWGRKFVYCSVDGRVVVFTALPHSGAPYDDRGGQPSPIAYPSIPAILNVIDRTGSSMYRDGLIPVALAHSKAAYPIGVGTDVLRLAARVKLGLEDSSSSSDIMNDPRP